MKLLAADQIGATRDGCTTDADLQPYLRAFDAIYTDPAHLLLVATGAAQVLATMQLSFLPGLAWRGALRAQIEAVRVRQDYRGRGLQAALFEWARRNAVPLADDPLWDDPLTTSRRASSAAMASASRPASEISVDGV